MTNLEINESLGSAVPLTGTRYKVRLIEGDKLGSSAYYPADTVATYGPRVFTRGTPMFIDHQTPDEKALKPFGSVGTFVGELAEDAYYDNDGLYAEVEVFEDAAPMIKARKDRIGISVRANVIAEDGLINGKMVPIAKQFTSARSVDFVMRPGAGGKIVSILESATEDASPEALEGEDMEKEVLESALAAFKSEVFAKIDSIEARVAPVEEALVEVDETAVYAKALEIAEAFAGSKLDAEGRSRVLDLHRANNKPIADLIAAEEAYVQAHEAEVEGVEESAVEAEESATATKLTVPKLGAWGKK